MTVGHNLPVPALFFFPSHQTHPPKNLKIWNLIPSSSFFQQTLNPPEKGGKKNPGINPGQLAGKGRKKKKKPSRTDSPLEKGEKKRKEKKKSSGTDSPPPAGKGRKKIKTLVLTLGSPPEKGGKKKPQVLTLGSPPEKGKKKKKPLLLTLGSPPEKGREKKTLVLTLGSPLEKGEKKKKKNKCRFRHRKSLWPVSPQKTLPELSRHGWTARQTDQRN